MTILEELFSDLRFLGFFAAIIAFLVSTRFYLYPNIISISETKGLMDAPGERKMHTTQIPTLGGLVQKTDIVYHLRRIKVNHPERVKLSIARRMKVNH